MLITSVNSPIGLLGVLGQSLRINSTYLLLQDFSRKYFDQPNIGNILWNRECSFPENDKNNCESNRVSNIRISCFHYNLKVTAEWSPAIKVSIIIKTKPAGGQWGNIYKYNNKSIITISSNNNVRTTRQLLDHLSLLNSIWPGVYCRINEAFIIDLRRNHIFIYSG